MKRAAVLACVALAGCGDSSGPEGLQVADIAGAWTLTLEDGEGRCFPDEPSPGLTIRMQLPAEAFGDPFGGDRTTNVVADSAWGIEENPLTWLVSGHFDLEPATFELVLSRPVGTDRKAVRLAGDIEGDGLRLAGSYVDEGAAWISGCSGDVSGAHN